MMKKIIVFEKSSWYPGCANAVVQDENMLSEYNKSKGPAFFFEDAPSCLLNKVPNYRLNDVLRMVNVK